MPRETEPRRDAARPASNQLFLKISGRRLRAYSIVKHVGRRSGREYVNPVSAYPLGDGFVITILYGLALPRALAQNWLLLFTAFLPALAIMIVLNNVAEEIGWTGFVFARFQDRHGPLRGALLTTVFYWLFHIPSLYVETRSWATTALVLGIFLLPHLGSRLITGWLYNSAGSSVLIAGLFHSMHNAIVNPTGLVAVVVLPQFEVLMIMAGIVVLAAAIIAVATPRPSRTQASESDADLNSEG